MTLKRVEQLILETTALLATELTEPWRVAFTKRLLFLEQVKLRLEKPDGD